MEGQRSTQPGDRPNGSDGGDTAGPGETLSDPNRLHVTLDNLIDLAHLDTAALSAIGHLGNGEEPDPPPATSPPPERRVWSVGPSARTSAPIIPLSIEAPPPPISSPALLVPPAPPRLPRRPSGEVETVPAPAATAPPEAAPPAVGAGGPPVRVTWARPAQRWLPETLALAIGSGAFVAPALWLVLTAVACVVAGSVAFVATGHPLRSLPWRAVRRSVTLLHPRSSVWAPVLVARVVLLSILVPGAIAAAVWLADEGRNGVVAAARTGAWTHGFRVAVLLVCVMLLTSVGEGRYRRADQLRLWAGRMSDGALVLLVAGCWVAATLVVVVLPHPKDPVASAADGLGWLPPPARVRADMVRDAIVTAELDVLTSCLSERGNTMWRTAYTSENGAREPDVARLLVGGSGSNGPPHDLATAVMAAHNQLAPWVETIEVQLASGDVIRIDRTDLPRHRPLTDEAELASATTGLQWLVPGSADVTLALRCSAGAVL